MRIKLSSDGAERMTDSAMERYMINPTLLVLLFFFAKGFDLITTYYGITRGLGFESNRISISLLAYGGWSLLFMFNFVLVLLVSVLMIYYQKYLIEKNASQFTFIVFRLGVLLLLGIVMIAGINNLTIILVG